MIFTSPIPALGIPEEQVVNGHGLTFPGNVFELFRDSTTPPVGMRGFRDADPNPDCRFTHMLTLGFTANPTNWRIEFRGTGAIADRATTWRNQQVGNQTSSNLVCQQSNAAAAVSHHTIRLILPRLASIPNSIRITLGATEQAGLEYAVFSRVACVLHPTPRLGVPRLAPGKKTTPGIDGKVHATLVDPDPLFSGRIHIEAWDDDRDIIDLDSLAVLSSFGLWPSGLESAFTLTQPIKYRRPDFARNCLITRTTGAMGVDGLDAPGGPTSIRLDLAESI